MNRPEQNGRARKVKEEPGSVCRECIIGAALVSELASAGERVA